VAGAEKIAIDGNGRILIPRRYLEAADIQGEVRFIGMDNAIEIWNRQKADNIIDNDSLADTIEGLMNDNK
jgi:MraZ protein